MLTIFVCYKNHNDDNDDDDDDGGGGGGGGGGDDDDDDDDDDDGLPVTECRRQGPRTPITTSRCRWCAHRSGSC